jgi:hypothetical protein
MRRHAIITSAALAAARALTANPPYNFQPLRYDRGTIEEIERVDRVMRLLALAGAMLLGGMLLAQSAAAATITKVIDFTATDFTSSKGNVAAPVPTVTGSFTLTYEPGWSYTNETSGIAVNALNIDFSYAPQFGGNTALNYLAFGGNGVYGYTYGTNDFFFFFWLNGAPGAEFHYTQAGFNNAWNSFNVAVSIHDPVATTPIPASLLMLLTGLGGGRGRLPAAARDDGCKPRRGGLTASDGFSDADPGRAEYHPALYWRVASGSSVAKGSD